MNRSVRILSVVAALLLSFSILLPSDISVFAEEAVVSEAALSEGSLPEDTFSDHTDHSGFSEEMLSAAAESYSNISSHAMGNSAPDGETFPRKINSPASLPYTGEGDILALHINFPNDPDPVNQDFDADDTAEALQNALGDSVDRTEYESSEIPPYSNLREYYLRASYNKLSLYGDAVSYTAQLPRSEYKDTSALAQEAFSALDDKINFRNYDGDSDGVIDCVILHIPCNAADVWGSTWWPSCGFVIDPISFDGMSLGSLIVLSRQTNTDDGKQTLIHEVGHAMGFPDYYSYGHTSTAESGLDGILTFDMMQDNTGDHNGFSKWMAGWFDESDITRVVANENGVSATRGGAETGTKNADGSVTLDLAAFDSKELSETGGIIVVGNNADAPFASYYLIQYDTFAGNQSVSYGDDKPLPSGFRVFRVQAELSEDGRIIRHNNTYDPYLNKLIELVDPDYMAPHTHAAAGIPYDMSQGNYNCMFYGGSSLTPVSSPSTNFMENIYSGYTGISIDFLESGENSGKLRISYSDEHKPEILPLEITLTSKDVFPGGCQVEFTANQDLALANPYGMFMTLSTSRYITNYLRDTVVKGNKLTGKLYFDEDLLKEDTEVIFRFQPGAFIINGQPSEKIEITLPLNQDLVTLDGTGYVTGTESADNSAHVLSPIFQAEDGSCHYYGYSGTYRLTPYSSLFKYTFEENDPGVLTKELLTYPSEEWTAASNVFSGIFDQPQSPNISIVPENADLGDYVYMTDAAKIGDYYYVTSFRKPDYSGEEENELAVSMLDAKGNLLRQVMPAGPEVRQNPAFGMYARLQPGPNNKLAVLLFPAIQDRDPTYEFLSLHSATFFFDQELSLDGRLDNYSTGCGMWRPDGSYLSFTQRVLNDAEASEQNINRTRLISYDITKVIDPEPQEEISYKYEEPEGGIAAWSSDSEDPLVFIFHRSVNDEDTIDHFTGATVDGVILNKDDFKTDSGSLVLSLLPAFLQTLPERTHTLTVSFDDGAADAEFKIIKGSDDPDNPGDSDRPDLPDEPDEPDNPDDPDLPGGGGDLPGGGGQSPKTADSSQPYLWLGLMAAAVIAIALTWLFRKKYNRK